MADHQNTSVEDNDDVNNESVEVLRERLNTMKRIMAERSAQSQNILEPIRDAHRTTGIIDGNFLSVAFGAALLVIISVSVYAFYNLYHAILKKFPSHHEEL